MSLFDDKKYQYRDTFYVFFPDGQRPAAEAVRLALARLDEGLVIRELRATDSLLESLSLECPEDNSAMDVCMVGGEEVRQQVRDLLEEFRTITLAKDDSRRLQQLKQCNSRFDILHFEEAGHEDDLDPGSMLLVVQELATMTGGVGLDPQSMTLL